MSLHRNTDLGTIKISDVLFAQIIVNSLKQRECLGKAWPATSKGKQIGNDQKFNVTDVASHIVVKHDRESTDVELEFKIIVQFGNSISAITEAVFQYVADSIEQVLGKKPVRIIINVTGIRSKQIARRNIEVIKQYEC